MTRSCKIPPVAMSRRLRLPVCVGLLGALMVWCRPLWLTAQVLQPSVQEIAEVGIDQKLDARLPLHLSFVDDSGQPVTLARYFTGEHPVVLTLSYSDCPMLCHLVLDGLAEALRECPLKVGTDFELINVSIDPRESVERARQTKQKYLRAYGKAGVGESWHFLVGQEEQIRALADAVGFRYTYVPERKEYAHAATVMICTPDGRMSRYLYGIQFPGQDLRLSLVDAGQGKIGSAWDQVLLYCFHYDAEAGRYGPVTRNIMKLGGSLFLVVMLIGLLPIWLRRRGLGSRIAEASEAESAEVTAPPVGDSPAGP